MFWIITASNTTSIKLTFLYNVLSNQRLSFNFWLNTTIILKKNYYFIESKTRRILFLLFSLTSLKYTIKISNKYKQTHIHTHIHQSSHTNELHIIIIKYIYFSILMGNITNLVLLNTRYGSIGTYIHNESSPSSRSMYFSIRP